MIFTPSFLNVTDDYPADQVNFIVSNLQHGQFQLLPLNNSVSQFTEQQLSAGQILFTHDNSISGPSYQIGVSDPYFTLSPVPAVITFFLASTTTPPLTTTPLVSTTSTTAPSTTTPSPLLHRDAYGDTDANVLQFISSRAVFKEFKQYPGF